MAFDVISTLDLDKELLHDTLILVKENSGCESNFFHSCLIAKQIKDNGAVCLVTMHNDINHYHSVGLKLGYNLNSLKDSGSIVNIDFLNIIANSIDNSNELNLLHSDCDTTNNLFKIIYERINLLLNKYSSAVIVLDDITHFLHMNFTISQIIKFVDSCRIITVNNKNCSLIIGAHVISPSDDSYMLSQLISHMSDIIIDVASLKTGRSLDVSGSFKITRPWSDNGIGNANKLTKLDKYLYKLFDRGIKVFAPGFR